MPHPKAKLADQVAPPEPEPVAPAPRNDPPDPSARVARPLLGALARRKEAIADAAAVAGYKLAVDLSPGDTILIPLKLVKVAATAKGVEVTFEDGKTLDLDDAAAVRMG